MKKIIPFLIIGLITVSLAVFIIWQIAHSTTHEEVFEASCAESCIGFSSSKTENDGFTTTTYSKGTPSTLLVIDSYKNTKKAADAFENLSVSGIGNLPDDGYTQNFAHNIKVYFVHNRNNKTYYCCGLVGNKLVFGMRSKDGNYFSQLYTLIRDTYFAKCIEKGF